MSEIIPDPKTPMSDALRAAMEKSVLPTNLSSDELRDLEAAVRARSFFTARGTSALFVQALKNIIARAVAGEFGRAEAQVLLIEALRGLGYTPENGFPDSPVGAVPPAEPGSLQDLSSFRRIDLIVDTNLNLSYGAGQQARGHEPDVLEHAPCWELMRYDEVEEPRNWHGRWEFAGGKLYDGRMIAPKGDPIWGEIGSSGNFDDALDVDFPPFAFNSGMSWISVNKYEAAKLGVTATTGQSIKEFHDGQPYVYAGQLPKPRLSMAGVDRKMVEEVAAETKALNLENAELLDFSALIEEDVRRGNINYEKRWAERERAYAERQAAKKKS